MAKILRVLSPLLGITLTIAAFHPLVVLSAANDQVLAAGDSHSAAIAGDGSLFTWGGNTSGQLGDGTTISRPVPRKVPGLGNAVAVAAGATHTLVLKSDGTVWSFGANNAGQLGDGTTTARSTTILITGLNNITAIAAGGDHSLALRSDGTLWAWGSNSSGELGDASTTNRNRPVQITRITGVSAIAAGRNHTLALRTDGNLWSWGNDSQGQLGDDDKLANKNVPVQIKKITGIATVAAGGFHSFAISRTGVLYAWGSNLVGQLGDGTTTQRNTPVLITSLTSVTKISGGLGHSIAVSATGAVYTWGDDSVGQLGNGGSATGGLTPTLMPDVNGAVSVAAGAAHTLLMKPDNTVYAWGANDSGQIGNGVFGVHVSPAPVPGLTGIRQIAAGDNFALALNNDGTVLSWGDNSFGQLGDGTRTSHLAPVHVSNLSGVASIAAGARHALALKLDGSVWAWGDNASGQLGDATTVLRSLPIRVGTLNSINAISAGADHSLALRSDGTLWEWGANASGQLGVAAGAPRISPIQVPTLTNVTAAAAGGAFTLALRADGTAWSWGDNGFGQLGINKPDAKKDKPTQITGLTGVSKIFAGDTGGFAIKTNGTLYGWGNNTIGQVGDGTITQRLGPVTIPGAAGASSVTGGTDHTLSVMTSGTVLSWGGNWLGELGDGTRVQRNNPAQVPGLSGIVAADASAYFSLVLRNDGTVLAWGNNIVGQLGDGTIGHEVSAVLVLALPTVSLATPSDGATFQAGAAIGLTVNTANPAGIIVKVEYFDASTKIGETAAPPFSFSWNTASTGQHQLMARATDSFGFTAVSSPVTITVQDPDTDHNGLRDSWETQYFGQIGVDPNADPDGDGRTNLQEFLQGTDPNDYFNGVAPVLTIISGNNQQTQAGSTLPQPLVVKVATNAGTPLVNAPIAFAVVDGDGMLSSVAGQPPSTALTLRTGADGVASVTYRQPTQVGFTSHILVSAASSSINATATFTERTLTTTGLIAAPAAVNEVVNLGQSKARTIRLTNYSNAARQFTTNLENSYVADVSFTDSDQSGGPTFVWNDISATGTKLNDVSDADEAAEQVALSFAFPYFGQTYQNIFVTSNGFITVGEEWQQYDHYALPDSSMPANEIAAFHTDLDTSASGDVYYQDFGDRLVVQFTNAARYDGNGTVTFQIVLHSDGRIFLYYKEVTGDVEDATVGVQDMTQEHGLTVAYQQPYLKNNLAVAIQIDAQRFSTSVERLSWSDSDQPGGPAFVWDDITTTGTWLDRVSGLEDGSQPFDISFAFPYFGDSYSRCMSARMDL